jgi:hypothetical protein
VFVPFIYSLTAFTPATLQSLFLAVLSIRLTLHHCCDVSKSVGTGRLRIIKRPCVCDSCSYTLTVQIHCCQLAYVFLDVFATLRKSTISFVMSACPSVHMEKLGSHWMDFHEILYLSIFRKSVHKIPVSLQSDKNSRYFT